MTSPLPLLFLSGQKTWELPTLPSLNKLPPRATLYPFDSVEAGMDLLRLYNNFGDRLSFMGGIDVRCLYNNDRQEIDAELEAKIRIVKAGNGHILHSDHSIPSNVDHDVYAYFIQKGLELGTNKE